MKPELRKYVAGDEYYTDERCHIIELSNTATDPAVSIARARVVPGVTTCWHRLRGITERYVILEGKGRVEVEDTINQLVGPGDTVIIPPLRAQRIQNTGSADLVFLAICSPRFVPVAYERLSYDKGRPEDKK